jgi:hypothetical protein
MGKFRKYPSILFLSCSVPKPIPLAEPLCLHAVVIKGRPCKVVDISKAKVGKHGAAKCHFVGIDIFTTKKYESICPASAQLSEPIVDRQEYQVSVQCPSFT